MLYSILIYLMINKEGQSNWWRMWWKLSACHRLVLTLKWSISCVLNSPYPISCGKMGKNQDFFAGIFPIVFFTVDTQLSNMANTFYHCFFIWVAASHYHQFKLNLGPIITIFLTIFFQWEISHQQISCFPLGNVPH